VGFAIVVAYFLYNGLQKVQPGKAGITALFTIIGVLSVPAAIKTIARNKEWKNDRTLFLTDVKTAPNSVLVLSNAGSACIDLADNEKDSVKQREFYNQGVQFLTRAVKINPKFSNGYQNRGVALYKLGYTDSAVANWDTVRKYYPTSPLLPYVLSIASNYYYRDGIKYGKANQHAEAAINFAKAAHVNPTDGDVWYNLGFALMNSGNYKDAVAAFRKSLMFQTKNRNAQTYLAQCQARLERDATDAAAPVAGQH
jgi:tetratricopeptide (TPR) repeat protein